METTPTSSVARPEPPARPESLSRAEAVRLRKATQDFESYLVAYMLKAMRETIDRPEDEKGLGREYYESLFDSEVATSLSKTQGVGLADILYRQLTGGKFEEDGHASLPSGFPLQQAGMGKLSAAGDPGKTRGAASDAQLPAGSHGGPAQGRSLSDYYGENTLSSIMDRIDRLAPLRGSALDRVNRYSPIVEEAARRYRLDPDLLRAVILTESNGWPKAVSPKGAQGLMQLMPATADTLDVKDPMDPRENILGGARYIRRLLDTMGEDVRLALASYNAGPGAVQEHGGVPPYNETRDFVRRVLGFFESLKETK